MNTVPPVVILIKIGIMYGYMHGIASPYQIFMELMKKSPIMSVLIPCQIVNTIAFFVLVSIIQYTTILYNDRNFIAWNGLISFCMIVHEVLNYWIKSFINKLVGKVDREANKDTNGKSSNIDSTAIPQTPSQPSIVKNSNGNTANSKTAILRY
ncbi:hypothetical protein HK103_006866 [Boothiomyces macroporosus]|uniref:Uncharacterized protein n=1 Tax=Boothiomyces macroporosus TaxID=261099 RepID=A0AAD5UG09_9FUNG|nr:hypothetical protein HK103_006866 [Boothiomyces macroporosus]